MNSCRPDENLIYHFLEGDPRAKAIVEAWKVRLPVVYMSRQELSDLSDRCRCVFDFDRADEDDVSSYADYEGESHGGSTPIRGYDYEVQQPRSGEEHPA